MATYTYSTIQVLPGVNIVGSSSATTGSNRTFNDRMPASWTPLSYTISTGANSANKVHSGVLTLVTNTPQTINLSSMSFGDGDSALTKIKGFTYINLGAGNVTVGGSATPFLHFTNTNCTITLNGYSAKQHADFSTNGVTVSGANNTTFNSSANTTVYVAYWGE